MAGKRRTETHLYAESLEGRALMAVNVFDIAGTWQRGLSDPGALVGTLSVDTDTGRVSAFNLLRTGGIKENTGTTVSTPTGRKLVGGTPLPDTIYGLDSVTFQGIKSGQYRIETALRGEYSMVATWQLPTGSLSSYAGGAVTFSFTSSVAYATSNPGSGSLKLANGAPYDISLSSAAIAENSPVGTRVGVLSTSDPTIGDTFTYALVPGTGAADNASFQIVGNELRANAPFDFEAKSGYTVRIRTTDRTGLSYEKALPITVTNVNEAPKDIASSNLMIAENSPVATIVGLLSTSDPDAGDTFVYTLVPGAGATDNASFQIVGNELRSSAVFDFETKNNYTVWIRTTDRGGLSYDKSFTIAVTDVPEDDSVPKDFLLGVSDQLRRDAWQAYQGDRKIDRSEMIALLRKTGESDGVVAGPEMTGLQRITSGRVGNGWEITMDDSVRSLARKVVEDNPANRMYQGTKLGSLNPAGGSTAGQMNLLVSKWFCGTDHPAANANGSYGYQSAAGSLFVNGPSYTDAHQGYLGDCYFIATLGSIAKSNPAAIQNMFLDNGDGTFVVRFFYPSGTTYVADYVTVDRMLPVSGSTFVYSNMGDRYSSVSNELWMPLAEKAYAQWNETGREGRNGTNTYSAIEGGWMSNVDGQVLGRAPADYSFSNNGNKQVLIDAINANKGVTIATKQSSYGLYAYHAYIGIGYDSATDTFRAHNPWGNSHPGPLTWSQLQVAGWLFTIADTSSVPPITTSTQTIIAPVPVAPAHAGVFTMDAVIAGDAPTSRMASVVGHGSLAAETPVLARSADVLEPSARKFHDYARNFANWQGGRSSLRSAGVSTLQGPRVKVAQEFGTVTAALAGIDPVVKG